MPEHASVTRLPDQRVIVAVLAAGTLAAALDATMVSTALPTMASDFDSLSHVGWVASSYVMASTATAPLWGRACDLFEGRRCLQAASAVLLGGSVLAGIAPSMEVLVAARWVQGVGGGGMIIVCVATMGQFVAARHRGKYDVIFGGMWMVAAVCGPVVSGYVTVNMSWRWVFWVNVPLICIVMLITRSVLRSPERARAGSLSLAAGVQIAVAVGLLVGALSWSGPTSGWTAWETVTLLAAGTLVATRSLVGQWRAQDPLFPIKLFVRKEIALPAAAAFLVNAAMLGATVYLPLYLQLVQGATPMESGLRMLPIMGGILASSLVCGQIISWVGRFRAFPIMGTAVMSAALASLAALDRESSAALTALVMALLGVGLGMTMQVLMLVAQNEAVHGQVGVVTAGMVFVRSLGGGFGVALLGGVLSMALAARATPVVAESGGTVALDDLDRLRSLPAGVASQAVDAYMHALQVVFVCAVPLAVVACALLCFMRAAPLDGGIKGGQESSSPPTPTAPKI